MADRHPYISGSGALTQVLDYLRKSFPTTFNADTLKKLSLAPSNESYILNILRFLKLIGEGDSRTDLGQKVFTLHADTDFHVAFSDAIEAAYADLFSLHHGATWTLPDDKLIPFFRQADRTSELVGTRQASTFRILSTYSGHEAAAGNKPTQAKVKAAVPKAAKVAKAAAKAAAVQVGTGAVVKGAHQPDQRPRDIGLTVRIEINLPATGDQDTYDKIFKSIKENFINA
jgi:hypothetical protein